MVYVFEQLSKAFRVDHFISEELCTFSIQGLEFYFIIIFHIFIFLSESWVFHIAFNFWDFSLISLAHLIIGTVFGDV